MEHKQNRPKYRNHDSLDNLDLLGPLKSARGGFKIKDFKQVSHSSNLKIPILKNPISNEKSKDQLSELSKWLLNSQSSDVSHLKDNLKSPKINLQPMPMYPTDIKHLEKLVESIESSNSPNFHLPHNLLNSSLCKKENCLDHILTNSGSEGTFRKMSQIYQLDTEKTPEIIERHNLGNPSGRQEVNNLKNWLEIMKKKYLKTFEGDESVYAEDVKHAELIYAMCQRELTRQISVYCIERGELLEEVFKGFERIHERKDNVKQREIDYENDQTKIENDKRVEKLNAQILKSYNYIKFLNEKIETMKGKRKILSKDFNLLTLEYDDFKSKHERDLLVWTKKEAKLRKEIDRIKESFVKQLENRTKPEKRPQLVQEDLRDSVIEIKIDRSSLKDEKNENAFNAVQSVVSPNHENLESKIFEIDGLVQWDEKLIIHANKAIIDQDNGENTVKIFKNRQTQTDSPAIKNLNDESKINLREKTGLETINEITDIDEISEETIPIINFNNVVNNQAINGQLINPEINEIPKSVSNDQIKLSPENDIVTLPEKQINSSLDKVNLSPDDKRSQKPDKLLSPKVNSGNKKFNTQRRKSAVSNQSTVELSQRNRPISSTPEDANKSRKNPEESPSRKSKDSSGNKQKYLESIEAEIASKKNELNELYNQLSQKKDFLIRTQSENVASERSVEILVKSQTRPRIENSPLERNSKKITETKNNLLALASPRAPAKKIKTQKSSDNVLATNVTNESISETSPIKSNSKLTNKSQVLRHSSKNLEARNEHLSFPDARILNESQKSDQLDFKIINIIPPDSDVPSWTLGFKAGYEIGKREGFAEGEAIGLEVGDMNGYLKAAIEYSDNSRSQFDVSDSRYWENSESGRDNVVSSSEDETELRRIQNSDKTSDLRPLYAKRSRKSKTIYTDKEQGDAIKQTESLHNMPDENEINESSENEQSSCEDIQELFSNSDQEEDKENSKYSEERFHGLNKETSEKRKTKEVTKFKEFKFHQRENKHFAKKMLSAIKLLKLFLSKKTKLILKKATMSRKMVNKLINNYYVSFMTDNINISLSFADLLYNDMFDKFRLKKVTDRKYLEFIASLLRYAEFKRSLIFLRFLGASRKISVLPYTIYSFAFYVKALEFMQKAKIGITSSYDETADVIYVPTVRAVECVKEKLEHLIDKNSIQNVLNQIEMATVNDPKKINAAGLVDTELVLELMIALYEEYQQKVINGVNEVISAIKYKENASIVTKQEFILLVRHISPMKFYILHKDENELNLADTMNTKEITQKCIEKALLMLQDVKNYCSIPEETSVEDISNEIGVGIDDMKNIAKNIDSLEDKIAICSNDWLAKLDNLQTGVYERELKLTKIAWKLYQDELRRLKCLLKEK